MGSDERAGPGVPVPPSLVKPRMGGDGPAWRRPRGTWMMTRLLWDLLPHPRLSTVIPLDQAQNQRSPGAQAPASGAVGLGPRDCSSARCCGEPPCWPLWAWAETCSHPGCAGSPWPHHPHLRPPPPRPSRLLPHSSASHQRGLKPPPRLWAQTPPAHAPQSRCSWSWVSPPASHPPRARDERMRGGEVLSAHLPGYPAQLQAPRAPHVLHPWASSAGLDPHPCAAASTLGASCLPGPGLHPCPLHSQPHAGHPGPCSQTRTPSGTPRLPTPFEGALRTAGCRPPKTRVPRPHGHRRQGPEPPRTLEPQQASALLPWCPQEQEHYTAQEAFTLEGGLNPPTHLQPVGPS